VEEVIEEIRYQTSRPKLPVLGRKFIQFWDDNPAADLDWFHDLLEKMIPLKKWWTTQICLSVADNHETLKLMKAAGCRGVFVGLESISDTIIAKQNKEMVNAVKNYRRQCRSFLKHGLVVVGAIMLGFDEDTEETLFGDTLKALEDMGVTMLQDLILTPYPHLEIYKRLEEENRIITKEAKYYNGYTVVHKPKAIHPAALQEGAIRLRKRFFSYRSMLRRIVKHNLTKFPEFLVWNKLWGTTNLQVIPGVNVEEWLKYLRTL